jgi:hypothetical protein
MDKYHFTYRYNRDDFNSGWTPEGMAIGAAYVEAVEKGAGSYPSRITLEKMILDLRGHDGGYAVTLEWN